MKRILIILIFLYSFTYEDYHATDEPEVEEEPVLNPTPLDLQDLAQDFVLETKQIRVEGFPTAFNPSIVKWRGSYLMSFRIRDNKTGSTDKVGLTWLDESFNPIGKPYILELHIEQPALISKVQDPRLICIDGRLYMVYTNMIYKDEFFRELKRVYLGEIIFEDNRFHVTACECLYRYKNENDRWEKNWTPFEYKGQLLLAYSLAPHRILWPIRGTRECQEFASSNPVIDWDWGTLRGGTQALLDGDHYLGFFHSSKVIATKNSDEKSMQHYFMGAYTFSAQPPFQITKISSGPIVGENFYRGPAHKTWKPLRVVFPQGLLIEDNLVWVFYGRQDHEIWVAKIDKQRLLDSLVPVK